MMPADIPKIQAEVAAAGLDGWLFYGFHEIDPIAIEILNLPRDRGFFRRWFYLVPARGTPIKLVNRIEADALDGLPGERHEYTRWEELRDKLRGMLLPGGGRFAMQYSPESAIPYISRVDAGTVELVRACGAEVVSSADLVQKFQAVWSDAQVQAHRRAAARLHEVVGEIFRWIGEQFILRRVDEYGIQQQMMRLFDQKRLVTDHPPIVAFNEDASNPHFSPTRERSKQACRGDILLIDLWGKEMAAGGVFADITWMGVIDDHVELRHEEVFGLAVRARDAGVSLLRRRWEEGRKICGWEVDVEVRRVIAEAGLGDFFIHRTGHSIGENVLHGNGVNLDNLETQDRREIIPGVCFSVEPGIYLPEFGVRTEINVFVDPREGPVITTQPVQERLVTLLE